MELAVIAIFLTIFNSIRLDHEDCQSTALESFSRGSGQVNLKSLFYCLFGMKVIYKSEE